MKSVEFGAKCNNTQVDRLFFIGELLFNAFNEGTRLPYCLKIHRRFFGVDARKSVEMQAMPATPTGNTVWREGYRHYS